MSNEAKIAVELFEAKIVDANLQTFGKFYVRELFHEYSIAFKNKKKFKLWYEYCEKTFYCAFYYGVKTENKFLWKIFCTFRKLLLKIKVIRNE